MSKCAQCSNAGHQRCSACKKVCYCSRECQQRGWPAHRRACLGAQVRALPSEDPFKKAMADFYASKSADDIAKGLLNDADYKRRKNDLDVRLASAGVVNTLFTKALAGHAPTETERAFILTYGSIQAIIRCIDGKEEKGDFLSCKPTTIDELSKSWPNSDAVRKYRDTTGMIFVSICTVLMLHALRPDLSDVMIAHSLTCLTTGSIRRPTDT
jgi:hypothetical protein